MTRAVGLKRKRCSWTVLPDVPDDALKIGGRAAYDKEDQVAA